MIATILGSLDGVHDTTFWAPITDCSDFPQTTDKELYRLDDGIGSGDVLIETSTLKYTGVRLIANSHMGGDPRDYSYKWPKGSNRVVTSSTGPYDFYPSSNLPQVLNRSGVIVFPITIPANHWDPGIPSIDSTFMCYVRVTAHMWYASDGYQPRFFATLVGDAPQTYYDYSGPWKLFRVRVSLPDLILDKDTSLQEAWDIATDEIFLSRWVLSSQRVSYNFYIPTTKNGKAVNEADSYVIDFSHASATKLSPDKGEFSFWFGRSTGIINNPEGIHPAMFSKAFYSAQEQLPEVSQNQIANICDLVNALRNFKKKPYLTIENGSSALKNAWLAYRYSYSTTKSDIQELAQISERLLSLGSVVKSFGSASDDSAKYFAEIVVDASYFMPSECTSLLRKLQTYGVKINFANVWDMIPYSFVADWFLDVSSLLESLDTWLAASSIPIREVWYSCVTSYTDGRSAYFRWLGSPPELPNWSYHVSNNGITWLKRMADAISLF